MQEGMRMLLGGHFGPPIYTYQLGTMAAEVYVGGRGYQLFIVGERLASYLGEAKSLGDCKEEIKTLEMLVESAAFKLEAAKYC